MMGVYYSWTGCVPQEPWMPSPAFLHWMNTCIAENKMRSERETNSGWHKKENKFVITPVKPDETRPSHARKVRSTASSSSPKAAAKKKGSTGHPNKRFGNIEIEKKKKTRKKTFSEQMYLDLMNDVMKAKA